MRKLATISDCGSYRYELYRIWRFIIPKCKQRLLTFIMLNPSTADAFIDDNTIKRCITFAKLWGFDGIRVVNLYAYRATKPSTLLTVLDPVGILNDFYLAQAFKTSTMAIAAWGNYKAKGRIKVVKTLVDKYQTNLFTLKETKQGNPSHPLYIPNKIKPKLYKIKGV